MSLDSDAHALLQRAAEEAHQTVLTTTQCARALGMSGEFIRGEIRDGRLKASVLKGGRLRARYRVDVEDFDAYRREYWQKTA